MNVDCVQDCGKDLHIVFQNANIYKLVYTKNYQYVMSSLTTMEKKRKKIKVRCFWPGIKGMFGVVRK